MNEDEIRRRIGNKALKKWKKWFRTGGRDISYRNRFNKLADLVIEETIEAIKKGKLVIE